MFAAFVLGVPMFAVVVEAIGIFGGDRRYDKLAREFTRLLLIAYSATAIWGAILTFALSSLYPRFWSYLTVIFSTTTGGTGGARVARSSATWVSACSSTYGARSSCSSRTGGSPT
jgi:hypothetical protein